MMSLLQTIIEEARQGGALEVNRLAARLEVSVELTQAMLEHLQRQGILREYACGAACQGCSLRVACYPAARLYQLASEQAAPSSETPTR